MDKPLSLTDFKYWFEKKDLSEFVVGRSSPDDKYIGKVAHTKVSNKKLLEKIETTADSSMLVSEFVSQGGKVVKLNGLQAEIQTESGIFFIPRFCIKIDKN